MTSFRVGLPNSNGPIKKIPQCPATGALVDYRYSFTVRSCRNKPKNILRMHLYDRTTKEIKEYYLHIKGGIYTSEESGWV